MTICGNAKSGKFLAISFHSTRLENSSGLWLDSPPPLPNPQVVTVILSRHLTRSPGIRDFFNIDRLPSNWDISSVLISSTLCFCFFSGNFEK